MHKAMEALKFGAKVAIVLFAVKYAKAGTLGTTLQSLGNTIS